MSLLILMEAVLSTASPSILKRCESCQSTDHLAEETIDDVCPAIRDCEQHRCLHYRSGIKVTCKSCPLWEGYEHWGKCEGHHEDCDQCGIIATVEDPPQPDGHRRELIRTYMNGHIIELWNQWKLRAQVHDGLQINPPDWNQLPSLSNLWQQLNPHIKSPPTWSDVLNLWYQMHNTQ